MVGLVQVEDVGHVIQRETRAVPVVPVYSVDPEAIVVALIRGHTRGDVHNTEVVKEQHTGLVSEISMHTKRPPPVGVSSSGPSSLITTFPQQNITRCILDKR